MLYASICVSSSKVRLGHRFYTENGGESTDISMSFPLFIGLYGFIDIMDIEENGVDYNDDGQKSTKESAVTVSQHNVHLTILTSFMHCGNRAHRCKQGRWDELYDEACIPTGSYVAQGIGPHKRSGSKAMNRVFHSPSSPSASTGARCG